MTKEYGAKNLEILEGLDAVRTRPGMYIGTTGVKGMHHLLWEIVDNSIDELSNGYGDTIEVKIYKDNSISVQDNGRGIPVDVHPVQKVTGVELVFTKLHAGGKFNSENYTYSGGLHGVGASVTNALSTWLYVEVVRGKKKYKMEFHSPNVDGKVKSGIKKTELHEVSNDGSIPSGTFVRFLPDNRVFKDAKFNYDTIKKRLKELAFLNKGMKIRLIDERLEEDEGETDYLKNEEDGPRVEEYHYEGGLSDFCIYLNEGKNVAYPVPYYQQTQGSICELTLAIQWTDTYTESIFSYVNNIPTSEGGTHETGLKSGLTKAFNDLARKEGYLKDKDENLLGEDFREGITAVLLIKMNNTQFEGQTKTKLGNPEIRPEVEGLVYAGISEYFNKKENTKFLEIIMKKAKGAAEVRITANKSKELARQKKALTADSLIGKLSSCSGKKAEENELFIVEGDSAGGSAKQGRNRHFQAILPLRGKPLNAEKKRISQVLMNEEIRTIITALGAGIGEDFNTDSLKYHKVVILSDADQDGAHIRAILLTFFYRYMKELITEGHVYIGLPPLYKISKKNDTIYAYSDDELRLAVDAIGKSGYTIQRYKGLGEMNPEQLWDTTMNPATRKMIKVSIDDAAQSEKIITTLMGDDVDIRKRYIFENADFNKVDRFEEFTKK